MEVDSIQLSQAGSTNTPIGIYPPLWRELAESEIPDEWVSADTVANNKLIMRATTTNGIFSTTNSQIYTLPIEIIKEIATLSQEMLVTEHIRQSRIQPFDPFEL